MICNHCGLDRAPIVNGQATSHVCRSCFKKISQGDSVPLTPHAPARAKKVRPKVK